MKGAAPTGRDRTATRGLRVALATGYLALSFAVVAAYLSPATGAEVSIYGGTPLAFWFLVTLGLLVGLVVALYAPRGYVSFGGLVLAGGSVFAVCALPLLRSYAYYGRGDGLTHLGWTKDIATGVLDPFALFYPGLHTISLFVERATGVGVARAMLLVVLAIAVSYFVFVPLCVRSITPRRGATVLAVFSGLLFLPVNQISVHYMSPHPISDAILLFPVLFYLAINYLTSKGRGGLASPTAVGGLLALTSVAVVVYHPMQAANVFVLFATFSVLQFGYGRLRRSRRNSRLGEGPRPESPSRRLYAQTGFLGAAFVLWVGGRGRFTNAVDAVLREMTQYVLYGSEGGAQVVAQRSGSLSAIGGSVTELFLKLFLVGAIYSAVTGLLMLGSLAGRLDDPLDSDSLVKHFTGGMVMLLPYSLVFFVGNVSTLFFRNFGLIMAVVTVLGAIGLHRYVTGISKVLAPDATRALTALGLAVMLMLSLLTMFASPYVYHPNDQVTDQEFSGYATALENAPPGIPFDGLRSAPTRWDHAVDGVGRLDYESVGTTVNNTTLTRLASAADGRRYLVLSEAMRTRELAVYRGLRYDRADFASVSTQRRVHRVQANDEVAVHLVRPNGSVEG